MVKHTFPKEYSQNDQLPIRIVSPDFGHLPQELKSRSELLHQRLPYYFFLFVTEGNGSRRVDSENFVLHKNELLFALPNQIQQLPAGIHGSHYFKLGFDEECLSRLPRQYPFLLDRFSRQKLGFENASASRLCALFEILSELLSKRDTSAELILSYLNSLLTEINTAYFAGERKPVQESPGKFIDFKAFIENNLTEHPTIREISEALTVSTDNLYKIVKKHSGLSPKEFLNNRLILEARRRLQYRQHSSVKELAYELGFNDPDYFSRLFKKVTGKTVARFFQDLS